MDRRTLLAWLFILLSSLACIIGASFVFLTQNNQRSHGILAAVMSVAAGTMVYTSLVSLLSEAIGNLRLSPFFAAYPEVWALAFYVAGVAGTIGLNALLGWINPEGDGCGCHVDSDALMIHHHHQNDSHRCSDHDHAHGCVDSHSEHGHNHGHEHNHPGHTYRPSSSSILSSQTIAVTLYTASHSPEVHHHHHEDDCDSVASCHTPPLQFSDSFDEGRWASHMRAVSEQIADCPRKPHCCIRVAADSKSSKPGMEGHYGTFAGHAVYPSHPHQKHEHHCLHIGAETSLLSETCEASSSSNEHHPNHQHCHEPEHTEMTIRGNKVEVGNVSEIHDSRSQASSNRTLQAVGLATAISISLHKLPEGFILYNTAAYYNPPIIPSAPSSSLGLLLLLSLGIHNLIEGLAIVVPLYLSHPPSESARLRAFLTASVLAGLTQPLGALFAMLIGPKHSEEWYAGFFGGLFAFVGGMMVWVAADGLLPAAWAVAGRREGGERHAGKKGVSVGFVGGIALMMACQVLVGNVDGI
ncbi:hypothetical protein BJ742DRAFT_808975 [Cladochytrium replicatum]|nr:hypothetical protein BJ742DRAFT_808975 [Cladochytrium replicatum]